MSSPPSKGPSNPVANLRKVGILEGISFLLLLGIAMPLKYLADQPMAVTVVGWIHGVLFVLFAVALSVARQAAGWSLFQSSLYVLAALLPFGPFVIDKGLRREEERLDREAQAG